MMEPNQEGLATTAGERSENTDDVAEPPSKKQCAKLGYVREYRGDADADGHSAVCVKRLETRLSTVLCCTVCLDLPISAIYQCPNGHLMCIGCYNHLLADGRLKNEMPTCPNCRIQITESSCTRNLAVEKAVSELPILCRFCKCDIPRCCVEKHEKDQCVDRLVPCKYKQIGCHWQGMFRTKRDHEDRCAQTRKSGLEIMDSLEKISKEENSKLALYRSIFSLFSFERILVHDLQLRPKRTDDFIAELFYETNRFSAFGQDWIIRAQVVGNEKSLRRGFTFQLVLTTKSNLFVKYIFVRSPYGDLETNPVIFQHEFNQESQESLEQDLPVSQDIDINKVLAARLIPLRLIMFLGKT